jgi:5-methylcytosine-specific restriction endonuclease McrA
MQNLLPTPGAAINRYDRIAAAKHLERRQLLQSLRPSVLMRYDAYAQALPNLETLSKASFSQGQVDALRHCYDTATDPLDELTSEIRNRQTRFWRSTCAYCGINAPETTDHYLPKTEFPEYAVCAQNLLPSCERCNTTKGTQWLVGTDRQVLHLYYDKLPGDVTWLFATILFEKGEPVAEFTLQQPPGFDPVLFRLVEAHYRTLRLLPRYRERTGEVLSEACANVSAQPQQQIAQVLLDISRGMARHQGHNHWKVAAYQAMAASTEFIEWLRKEVSPPSAPP